VEYGKAQGDFKVNGKYTFEIGGRSKDFSQIAGVKDSYVFADDWDMPDGAKPLPPVLLLSSEGCRPASQRVRSGVFHHHARLFPLEESGANEFSAEGKV